jgi:hypothetical protein
MNRHDRRAASSRARRRRTGYLYQILGGRAGGDLSNGVHLVNLERDPGCGIYRHAGCTCVPNISVNMPDGMVVTDEHGRARRVGWQ